VFVRWNTRNRELEIVLLVARGSKELCRKVELVLQRSRRLAEGQNKKERSCEGMYMK
jgi:hypothetical protein